MDCTVTIEGPGTFRTSPRIEVAVGDVKMLVLSDVQKTITSAVEQGIAAYVAASPPAPAEPDVPDGFVLVDSATLERAQAGARFYEPWREWSDDAVWTPAMLGSIEALIGGMSHALGELDSDWIDAAEEATPDPPLPLFDVLTRRVEEIVGYLTRDLTPSQIDRLNEEFATNFPGGNEDASAEDLPAAP